MTVPRKDIDISGAGTPPAATAPATTAAQSPLMAAEEISIRFRAERTAFTMDIGLDLPGKGVTGVFGPSGSGKTTLLRALAGLDRWRDAVICMGQDVWQDTRRFIPTHRRPIGFVFQQPSLFSHLSVRGNLEYGWNRVSDSDRRITWDRVVDLMDMAPLLTRRPNSLSGGEKQRVAIARALLVSPRLLLMDEPLASLDRARKSQILPYLQALHREFDFPVVYVTHALDELVRLADHVVLLEQGRVSGSGPIGEVLTRLDAAPAHDDNAVALVEATVAEHDTEFGLMVLDFPGGRFAVPATGLEVGSAVRLKVAARDVSLSLTRHEDSSIQNVFQAEVLEIASEGPAQMTVRLSLGGVPILARVTRKSAIALDLGPGRPVFVQIKSVAVEA